jgi:hypothetical protein
MALQRGNYDDFAVIQPAKPDPTSVGPKSARPSGRQNDYLFSIHCGGFSRGHGCSDPGAAVCRRDGKRRFSAPVPARSLSQREKEVV